MKQLLHQTLPTLIVILVLLSILNLMAAHYVVGAMCFIVALVNACVWIAGEREKK